MGLYYDTNMCIGNYETKRIDKKIKLASMNSIIEHHEWQRGYVVKDELAKITEIPLYDEDLFLEEVCSSTYDYPIVETYRYIIIK